MSAADAVAPIQPGATICISGSGGGLLEPDFILTALEQRFLTSGQPRDLTLVHAASLGDGEKSGLNRLVHPGMVKRVIGGHWGWSPRMSRMALDGDIEAYNFPQGVISLLFREIASGRPGLVTRTGLNTFADPRVEGGRLNPATPEDIVSLLSIDGQDYLFYRSFPVDAALLLGSIADERGNISFEREPAVLDALAMAMAAHNGGGRVIVQVKDIVPEGALDARLVKIPAFLVDAVVHHPQQWQTYEGEYNASFSGERRIEKQSPPPLPLNARKIIARRAAMELRPYNVVNLGFGMPDGVAAVAAEEGLWDKIFFTVEQGPVGGIPAKGAIFGVSANPDAILDMPSNFDFYHGGGLGIAALSFAQVDASGNVNVSRFGDRLAGCGGFVDISQNAAKVLFLGTFTAGGLDLAIKNGRLAVRQEGRHRKFLHQVDQITFSGRYAAARGQSVLYITERAVFELVEGELMLSELAPGIDLERDVLRLIDFAPRLSPEVREMTPALLRPGPMGPDFFLDF